MTILALETRRAERLWATDRDPKQYVLCLMHIPSIMPSLVEIQLQLPFGVQKYKKNVNLALETNQPERI